jgi:hypothetical protein
MTVFSTTTPARSPDHRYGLDGHGDLGFESDAGGPSSGAMHSAYIDFSNLDQPCDGPLAKPMILSVMVWCSNMKNSRGDAVVLGVLRGEYFKA